MSKAYKCKDCGREKVVDDAAAAPECCGHKMAAIDLNPCGKAYNAETSRLRDPDEACDDGVR